MKPVRSIRGMHDILPADSALWRWLESNLARLFGAYDFHEIRTPLLEKTEVFTRAIGQSTDVVEKEMYAFEDRNGDSLCLRPEGTAGVVRSAIQHGLLHTPGVKVWYQGPMFRHERPQKGRQRQFHQFGCEVFGLESAETDVELIAMATRAWRELGVDRLLTLEINSLGDRADREQYRARLVDFLEPHRDALDSDSLRRLETNPLRIFDSKVPATRAIMERAPKLADSLGEAARTHFERVTAMLDALGIEYTINPGLVRGLDYYCRTVFEWTTEALGAQGTVCAGGRYDELVEIQGGRPTPGVGFALGTERLLELVRESGTERRMVPQVYLVSDLPGEQRLAVAEQLRDRVPGLRMAVDLAGGSFKAQFKRAGRSGARFAVVVGAREMEEDSITLKDLREDRPQQSIARDRLGEWLGTPRHDAG